MAVDRTSDTPSGEAKYSQEQPTEKGARKSQKSPGYAREEKDVRAKLGYDPTKKKTGEF
jgi:hypothetical protein